MNYVGIYTLAKKEIKRFMRVPFQTLGQPVVTTVLYFLVFGYAIGNRIGAIEGISYGEFIMPGLIMMNIVITAFSGVSFGLLFPKIMNTISDILVSPMSYTEIALGFTIASVLRSMVVGALIYLTALFFIPARIDHALFLIFFTVLVAATFSLFGIIIGIWAENFEQISIFPTFLIMPLSFLGGVFYSIDMLPPIAKTISMYNPFLYMISGMRYGFYGFSDVSPIVAIAIVGVLTLALLIFVSYLLKTGYKLRN